MTQVESEPRPDGSSQRLSDASTVLAVFLAFTGLAMLSWESFGSWGGPSFFYPAAGITAGAMMISRRTVWPAIAVAVVAAEVLVDTVYGSPLWVSAGFAAANLVEPIIGASLVVTWCNGRPDLRRRRDFAFFIAGACVIAPIFGALIGGTVSSLNDGSPWHSAALTWWAGDALGVLVMASPILLWRVQAYIVRSRPWELAAVMLITGVLSVATFWTDFPPSILILPVLAWAGFRLGMLGAAMGGAVAAFLANIMSTHGNSLYIDVHLSPEGRVAVTQIYVAVIVVVAMLIAQEAAARSNAVREREIERRERIRLETLSGLAQRLSDALTPDDIGDALEEHVFSDAGASAIGLGLVSSDGRRLNWITGSGYPPELMAEVSRGTDLSSDTLAADVVRSGTSIEMRNPSEFAAAYPHRADLMRLNGTQAIASWPLAAGGEPFGVLQLTWSEPQPFDEAQDAYFSAVATMVSQALVRARIYSDEHARATVLHSVVQPLVHVDAAGLDYRTLYQPADAEHGVGGDWYTVMALPEGRTYLSVGDVIGHGLPAVEDMAQLRATGSAYAHQGLSAAQVLNELNRFAGNQIRGEFATNLVAIYDPEFSSLSYSSAGHPPALLRRAATGEVVQLSDVSGPMLGPFEDTVYVQSVVPVEPDDVLVMYTDGLVEHEGVNVRTGIAHLERVVSARTPEELMDCEAWVGTLAPAPHDDDVCVLVVRFGASGAN